VVAFDGEGARAVSGAVDSYLDLARPVGLYPDRGVAGSSIPEEWAEDEGSHGGILSRIGSVYASPTIWAITVTPATMRTAPIMSKTTPERTILVIGIMPEP
jgi:hypothetical protein